MHICTVALILKTPSNFNANYDGLVSRVVLSMQRVNNGLPCGWPKKDAGSG